MIRQISIILLLAISSGLYAQRPDIIPFRSNLQKPDSLKKPRILKEWTLSADYSEEKVILFDTVFSLSNRFKIADKYSPVNASLGNYGLPFYQISFFDRITDPDKFLYAWYYPVMHHPSNALFMNTQVPFTELDWSFAGPRETSEQAFRVRHSQNVNRFLNFGLIYDIIFSLGQYNYQRAADKTFTFFSSYTGDRYKLYFSAGLNNITSFENGGIKRIEDLALPNTRDIEVNMGGINTASSNLKNRSLLLVQRYKIGGHVVDKTDTFPQKKQGFLGLSGTFSHIFTLESNKKIYSDKSPESGFYDTIYINKSVTSDSLYSRSVKNTIRFDFTTNEDRKFRFGGGVGIRNEVFKYGQIVPEKDSLLKSDTLVWNKSTNVLVGRLYNNIGEKFRWLVTGELFLTGYRAGDFNLNGEIIKSFDWKKGRASWLLTGSMMNRQPSIWYEHWGGNNIQWNNNLDKEFRIDLGSSFSFPARNTVLKFNYAIIKNYTDFDSTALPAQYSSGLSVLAVTVRKDLRVWKFHLDNDVIIQKSSNSGILDLPLLTTRSAAYFEHLFRFEKTGGKLNTQLGADVTYNTTYYPYSYMPATGRFYRQDQVTAGNYPFINVFLNLKIKRTRLFVMFDHVNAGQMGFNYQMIPSYPMNTRMLRYGLAWTFYN